MDELKPCFPIALSSSLVSAYKLCGHKFMYEYVFNRVPIAESVHLLAGGAYAIGHETFRNTYYAGKHDEQEALTAGFIDLTKYYGADFEPHVGYKTWDRTAQAFLSYYHEWHPKHDTIAPVMFNNKPAVEFSFAIPLPILHPDTNEPILYAGRFDALMEMGRGAGVYVYDDKTTGSMGASWSKQWDLRSQFTGYVWGAEMSGIPIAGVIIRGACIQKTDIKFAQAITSRPEWHINRWYEDLLHTVHRMVEDYKSNVFGYNLDFGCSMYGECQYKPLCEVQDPLPWMRQDYQTRTWEPIQIEHL